MCAAIFWCFAVMVSCAWLLAGCVSTPTTYATRDWLGETRQDLFAAWGAPDQVRPDAHGGKILTYERVSGYITPGSATADTTKGTIVSVMQPHRTTHHQEFFVDRNGRIYRWQRQ